MKRVNKILIGIGILVAIAASAIYYCNQQITQSANAKLYNSVTNIPYKKTGLLLGTGKYLKNGSINPYYQYRINATIALFNAQKIKYLVTIGITEPSNARMTN